jgi:hypothetical protein
MYKNIILSTITIMAIGLFVCVKVREDKVDRLLRYYDKKNRVIRK